MKEESNKNSILSLQSYVLSTAVWTRAIILSTLLIFPHLSGGEGWRLLLLLKNYCLWWGRVRVNSTQVGSIWAAHFPSVSLTFIKDRFKNQLLTKADFLAVAVFRQCPKVMLQKVLDFENQLVKTSHCALNDCFGGHSKRNSQNTFRGRKVSRWPWLRGHRR